MGRVEEAMRRAAEAAGDATRARVSPDDDQAMDQAAGHQCPAEAREGPGLRRIAVLPAGPAKHADDRPKADAPTISSGKLARTVDSKTVIDQGTDQASKEQYRRLATSLYAVQE